jgi:insecticidal toxin complex protein TccC
MNMTLHAYTPILVAVEPRGLAVRRITQCRAEPNQATEVRITRKVYDVAGRLVSQCDPRLAHPNLRTIYNLKGRSLFTDSVDAGWRLLLLGDADQVAAAWDGRGIQRQTGYDIQMRPVSIVEQGLVSERLVYGGPDDSEHNRCNQLIRHDDTAGTRYLREYGLRGSPLTEARSFLLTAETPNWPLAEAERDALSESNRQETRWIFNALGETIRQTDALGHSQCFRHTIAGQLKAVELTSTAAAQPQTLVSDIHYNALDQVEEQTSGNGVVSRAVYDPASGLLQSMSAGRAAHENLQSLHYAYDPVGNILHIEDTAQPVRFFSNQRVEPVSRYTYDTLYQLIEATGREVNTGASHGPALPALQTLPPDANRVGNYTQHYDYDAGGNLLRMRHVGAQSFTRTLRVAPDSNRSLPEGEVNVDFSEGFDPNGNLLHLVRGQTLDWDLRNQLRQITTVTRDDSASDCERYVYDGQGQRCRKISSAQTSGRTLNNEVRYLPGLEIRTTTDGEILHVITAHNARVLHWQAGLPSGIDNDQIRYSLNDHSGSSTLELDQHGGLISQESYYPFGGTSWWAARGTVEAKYKTIRYSGKERDASGLYYYGFRYYAPWLQRWISADPIDQDGINRYVFVLGNPIKYIDFQGLLAIPLDIFISDIINPLNKSIGTGEFEELTWSAERNSFTVAEQVYGRGMRLFNGTLPEWRHDNGKTAFAIFRDENQTLRLFVNNYQQHMGIQPQMGMPEAAGLVYHQSSVWIFNNHSGHYKPPSSLNVNAFLKELSCGSASVIYDPLPEFDKAGDLPRITSLRSPESYADTVSEFKTAPDTFIPYLKANDLWETVQLNTGQLASYAVLAIMDTKGISRGEAWNEYQRQSRSSAGPLPSPAVKKSAPRLGRPLQSFTPTRSKKSSFSNRLFGRRK